MSKKITIELSQVDYDFLHNLSTELNKQDNRATTDPYFYQVKEEKELPTVSRQTIDIYRTFLTEKACKKHISENKHHYNKPVDYIEYFFKNPELEHLIKIIKSLTNETPSK